MFQLGPGPTSDQFSLGLSQIRSNITYTNIFSNIAARSYKKGQYFFIGTDLYKAIENIDIDDELTPLNTELVESNLLDSLFWQTSYSTEGLSFETTNGTYEAGGYFRLGNIVVVNLRVTMTSTGQASGAKTYVTGFPRPLFNVTCANNVAMSASPYISTDGNLLKTTPAITASVLNCTCIYLTID